MIVVCMSPNWLLIQFLELSCHCFHLGYLSQCHIVLFPGATGARPRHLQSPSPVHTDHVPDNTWQIQTRQAALWLEQLQGGMHSWGLQLLADWGVRFHHFPTGILFYKVEYAVYDVNGSVADVVPGKLFPNVKGCGYPPIVDCDGT